MNASDATPSFGASAAGPPRPPLLRVLACGSVDDGKSTLLARLLHDCGRLRSDELAELGGVDEKLALVLDGLEAEREQGITVDVTHRTFDTPRRRIRLLDAPGHEQYTRNMATAASVADVAILLVDIGRGILPQTRRHAAICALFGIRHLVLAVNKMDAVGYAQGPFAEAVDAFAAIAGRIGFDRIEAIPVSGLRGDNVVAHSDAMPWWTGPTLLSWLEGVSFADEAARRPLRLPVQAVLREGTVRRYAGTVASGVLRRGAVIHLSPSGRPTTVADIGGPSGQLDEAPAGTAVTIAIADEVDLARGDVVADPDQPPHVVTELSAHLVWFGEEPLAPGRSYLFQLGTRATPGSVERIEHLLDVETGEERSTAGLAQNEIGLCRIAIVASAPVDLFAENPALGCFIVVDRTSFDTVGAGVVRQVRLGRHDVYGQAITVSPGARAGQKGHRPAILWFTGLSGAGKSTVANLVEERLYRRGCHSMLLDGDNVRQGLNRDLGFSEPDRRENVRRVAEVAKLMLEAGLVVLCSFISPFRIERDAARALVGEGEFLEIFVDAPLDECIRRDPKGLYERALAGKIADFTGIWSGYEPPEAPEIHLDTQHEGPEEAADRVVAALRERGII